MNEVAGRPLQLRPSSREGRGGGRAGIGEIGQKLTPVSDTWSFKSWSGDRCAGKVPRLPRERFQRFGNEVNITVLGKQGGAPEPGEPGGTCPLHSPETLPGVPRD